jgi:3-keto-disaccharide hydrolase
MSRRVGVGFLLLVLSSLAGCFFLLPTVPEILYEEEFGPESNWYVGASENRTWWIENGEYHVLIQTEDKSYGARKSGTEHLADFQLDIDLRQLAGPDDNGYGVQFRVQDATNYYRIWISGDGYARFTKTVNGTTTNIIAWESTSLIHQGVADNHMTVVADGNTFTFYINGDQWKSAVDTSYPSGQIGVMAAMYDSPGPTHITFDNLIIQAVE